MIFWLHSELQPTTSHIMFSRTSAAILITYKAKILPLFEKPRRPHAIIHDIALIHTIVVTIVMTIMLYVWKAAGSSGEIVNYLHSIACSYEASDGIPPSIDQFIYKGLFSPYELAIYSYSTFLSLMRKRRDAPCPSYFHQMPSHYHS